MFCNRPHLITLDHGNEIKLYDEWMKKSSTVVELFFMEAVGVLSSLGGLVVLGIKTVFARFNNQLKEQSSDFTVVDCRVLTYGLPLQMKKSYA